MHRQHKQKGAVSPEITSEILNQDTVMEFLLFRQYNRKSTHPLKRHLTSSTSKVARKKLAALRSGKVQMNGRKTVRKIEVHV